MSVVRILWISFPIFLLGAAAFLYLGFVQPMTAEHGESHEQLAGTSLSLLEFIERNDLYPSEAIIQEMVELKKDLQEEVTGLLTPVPENEGEYGGDLEAIFEKWAYPSTHSALIKIRHFEGQVMERMGSDRHETASHLAKSLSISFCRSGLYGFEQLGCRLLEDPTATEEDSYLDSFEVDMVFVASATEALEFIEDWVFNAWGGFLILPISAGMERSEPGLWDKNLSGFSSPPLKIELKARVFYSTGSRHGQDSTENQMEQGKGSF